MSLSPIIVRLPLSSDTAYANAPHIRSLFLIFPFERIRSLRGELITQGPRVVIVDQHHRLSAAQAVECVEYGRMLLSWGNRANIELDRCCHFYLSKKIVNGFR